ncbi:MAG TPA: glycosyltransferase family 4 protein [Flavisolibacter sp.]|jgi:glycosyltransferase involved in cell wall biosynthesis|nr:glycosyltransferase family 4 protein [Flavisolibacter sp.]
MSKKKKVMVIGHEASLSGAPVLLLNLFSLLVKKEVIDVQFVIRRGGPLASEYKKLAPVIVLKPPKYGEEKSLFLHLLNFFQNKIKLVSVLFNAFSCDYFFFNTVVNGKLMRWFRFYKKPAVTYIHELEKVIDLYLKQNDALLPLTISDLLAYPSLKTRKILAEKYSVPDQKLVKLLYYFPFSRDQYDSPKAFKTKQNFRQRFGIKETDFVVGAVGSVTERKGVDLFMEVCQKVVLIDPSIKFVWIGSFENEEQELNVRNEIKEKQLDLNLIFTGPLTYDVYNFSPFDIFFLSSREDTYPLVVLEAAIMKVPSMCFSGSGGIVEFIGADGGWIIDDFSTELAADKIMQLYGKINIIQSYGVTAFEKVLRLHCDEDIIVEQFKSVIAALKEK